MNIYRNTAEIPAFRKPVITIGSFDGVHRGHQKILERIRNIAEETGGESVVITFHPHPRKIIFPKDSSLRLLNTLDEKLELLQKYKVDHVCVLPFSVEFSQMHPAEYVENFLIKTFHPAYIVIGYDHKFGLNRAGDIHLLRSYESTHNFKVLEIPVQELEEISISSTKIRNALEAGNIQDANRFLNHPYRLTGKVIHGDKLGSKLGYPTANISISDKDKLIPKEGVYAVKIDIEGESFNGMMYIGKRPTLSGQDHNSVEVHIFDFDQNIYDQILRIEVMEYMREDRKFADLSELTAQLNVDEKQIRMFFAQNKPASKAKPKVTLAILNYNGVEYLESFLPMMLYSCEKYEAEVVVIDNSSSDGSAEYIREWHPEIKVVELTKNYGYAAGYNIGIKDIDSEYIVFMNSDVLVREKWLDPIIEMMELDQKIGAAQPLVLSLENKAEFEYAGAAGGYMDILGYPFCRGRIFDRIEINSGQYDGIHEVFWASGAALVTRTALFSKTGGFDTGYFAHHEEIDYCWRIKRAGYKVVCNSAGVVYHLGGGTLAYDNPRKTFLNFKNNMLTLLKNEAMPGLLIIFIIRLILDGIAGLKFILEGKAGSAMAIIKAHFQVYASLPALIRQRSEINAVIRRYGIGKSNSAGRYYGSIVADYFLLGKKYFTDLKIK